MFRQKAPKLYRSENVTIDEIHKNMIKKMDTNYKKMEYMSTVGDLLVNYYRQSTLNQHGNKNDNKTENETELEIEESVEIIHNQKHNSIEPTNNKKEIIYADDPNDNLKLLNTNCRTNRKTIKTIKKRKTVEKDLACKPIFQFSVNNVTLSQHSVRVCYYNITIFVVQEIHIKFTYNNLKNILLLFL